jgi:hypothetical protein
VSPEPEELVIRGVTLEGKPFRPSDWSERLCGVMSVFGAERRMEYSPYVQPITSAGVKCVVVAKALEDIEPMAYKFLLGFARDNELQVRPGRLATRGKDASAESGAGSTQAGTENPQAGSATTGRDPPA